MPRRCKRRLHHNFSNIFFKPRGIQLRNLEIIVIYNNELEVLRLRYIEKLTQEVAAKKMGISQSQYQRDMVTVLEKITDALINGKAVEVKPEHK